MDEARFVNFLEESFGFDHGTGIGDDTSVVEIAPGAGYQLITKDLFIQDTHFSFDYYTPREVAQKALAVNLSDIAAMGGEPLYCYLGLGFPAKLRGSVFDDFFRGLREGCQKWNVQLAGGDYSSAPLVFISITLVGKAQSPVLRSTAQTGDLIGITGCTGESAAGLK
ncbi:MAG: thiamine-monophosphate kinase, partial [bacterium]|nr:thiamine-monophosphate kinase [bacterium]